MPKAIETHRVPLLLTLFSLAVVGVLAYLGYEKVAGLVAQSAALSEELSVLKLELVKTKERLATNEGVLEMVQQELANTQAARDQLELDLESEKAKIGPLTSKVQEIAGTVGSLEKLSKLDPEFLKKYSKVYFLNENYVPQALSVIDSQYVYPKKELKIHSGVAPFLAQLLSDAAAADTGLMALSSYRSFADQVGVKSSYTFTYGAGTANSFSAEQGYSEHQLGTAVDFTTKATGNDFDEFESTRGHEWLLANAYKYGFIISYPEKNSYYRYEPWHWRFVGRELAKYLFLENKYFYELDEREIDSYLISIFD